MVPIDLVRTILKKFFFLFWLKIPKKRSKIGKNRLKITKTVNLVQKKICVFINLFFK